MDIKGDKGGREVARNRDFLTSNECNIISAFSVFLRVLLTSNLYLEVKDSFGERSSYSSVFFFAETKIAYEVLRWGATIGIELCPRS